MAGRARLRGSWGLLDLMGLWEDGHVTCLSKRDRLVGGCVMDFVYTHYCSTQPSGVMFDGQ